MNVGPYDARAPVRGLGASYAPPLPSTSYPSRSSTSSCPVRPGTTTSSSPPPYPHPATSSPHASQQQVMPPSSTSSPAPVLPPRPGQMHASRIAQNSPMVGQSYGASMRPAYGYGSAYPSSYGYGQGYGRAFSSAGYGGLGGLGGYSAGFGSPADGPIENR